MIRGPHGGLGIQASRRFRVPGAVRGIKGVQPGGQRRPHPASPVQVPHRPRAGDETRTAPVTTRTGSAPPPTSVATPRCASVCPPSSTRAFGCPSRGLPRRQQDPSHPCCRHPHFPGGRKPAPQTPPTCSSRPAPTAYAGRVLPFARGSRGLAFQAPPGPWSCARGLTTSGKPGRCPPRPAVTQPPPPLRLHPPITPAPRSPLIAAAPLSQGGQVKAADLRGLQVRAGGGARAGPSGAKPACRICSVSPCETSRCPPRVPPFQVHDERADPVQHRGRRLTPQRRARPHAPPTLWGSSRLACPPSYRSSAPAGPRR